MTNDAKLQNTMTKKSAPKKRKIASLDKRKSRVGWYFVLPFLIGFVLIYLPVIFDSVKLSFFKINILQGGGYSLTPVGFENYAYALLEDPEFVQVLVSGMKELAFDIPAIIIFSLFMAVLLNQKMVGRAAFRAIFFIPVILSTGIMGSIEAQNILGSYMDSASGIDDGSGSSAANEIVSAVDIERLFSNMKVGTDLMEMAVGWINNIYDIVNRSGVQMLIFLSALQSISPAIYEACRIDGATAWETFWKITFPMISPMILVNGVYTIVDAFTTQSNSVMSFIKSVKSSAADGDVVASAMSWMYFLIVIAIVSLVALIFSSYVFYQRRD
ncbi:MAG: sugar ABC transporter permease [Clostridia bacterium]|nr:sugar ABC transporter permease [Clostridia bacterium]